MAIDVTCPGCKARFQVSEKFAGKKGPCPKCKAVIIVPAVAEKVEIHAPEVVAGPKGSMGQAALKPLKRTETKVSVPMIVAVVGTILVVLVMAFVLRVKDAKAAKDFPQVLLIFSAMLLGPPLAWAGYSFLRDDELEPYRGRSLWLRVSACGLVYAALWGVYWGVKMSPLLDGRAPQAFELICIIPFFFAGGCAAFVSLDLSYGNGLLHYGLYLLVTVLLRWIVNIGVL